MQSITGRIIALATVILSVLNLCHVYLKKDAE